MRKEIIRSHLNDLVALLEEARLVEGRVAAATAQYACVSANGHLEDYLKSNMNDFFRVRCDPTAHRIVKRTVDNYYNFKHDRILKFFNELRPSQIQAVEDCFASRSKLADALGSIVGNKNTLAAMSRHCFTGCTAASTSLKCVWLKEIINSIRRIEDLNAAYVTG